MIALVTNAVELYDRWLRVYLDGIPHDFHYRWLRAYDDQDRHPLTNERTLDPAEVPADVVALSAEQTDAGLVVEWSDGRRSTYAAAWLAESCYAVNREFVAPPSSDVQAVTVAPDRGVAANVLKTTGRFGVAVVRGFRRGSEAVPEDTETLIEAFQQEGLQLIGTHFGRIEDLRTDNTTNQNTDQLGYTDAPVHLHTDQPFLEHPPKYQLLHCMRTADQGGDSYLVNAYEAALYLQSVDAEAFRILTETPVRFHRKQKAFEAIVESPILNFTAGGGFQVRFSYFTTAPIQVPFAQMEAWLRAYDRFSGIIRNPRFQYRLRLEPGDFVFYDNHAMLHARTAFQGPRWVRGVYFNPVR